MIQAKVDLSSMRRGLAQLLGPQRESVARSMGVAGGQVLRDEAKLRAPKATGRLEAAIYLAYKQARSTHEQAVYSVTWNARKAPHGHLVEFGHWQPFVTYRARSGEFVTTNIRRAQPKWIAAHPFLRPALDAASGRAYDAMIKRGRQRLFDLLADPDAPDEYE